MAIPFLNHLDLRSVSELQNAILHKTTTATASNVEGKFLYDTGTNTMQYYNGSAWVNLDGTDTGITSVTLDSDGNATSGNTIITNGTLTLSFDGASTEYVNGEGDLVTFPTIPAAANDSTVTIAAGDGLSGGGSFTLNQAANASITINIGAGDGIDLNQDDIAVLVDGTTIDFNGNGEVSAVTAAIVDGGTGLATADQIHDFVIGQNYISGNETITLTGEVTGSGATSISTTVADNVLDIANFTAATIVTEAEGIENNDNDTTIPTSAAVKDYVDDNIVGGLIYQGGYDASTNTPDLDGPPSPNNIKKGWTYTVTADGTFFTEQVRVGDVLIAEVDAPTALGDWTTVQNNIDLASLTQVGIGNVNAGTGISVAYSNGTATVTNTVTNTDTQLATAAALIDVSAMGSNTTASFTHSLASKNLIVQMHDVTTGEVVFADIDHTSNNAISIIFAATPTNDIRVVVIDAKNGLTDKTVSYS